MLLMRSTDGLATCSYPITLKRYYYPYFLNDKYTLNADSNDSDFVYACGIGCSRLRERR